MIFTPAFANTPSMILTQIARHPDGRCTMTRFGFATSSFRLNSDQMTALLFVAMDLREEPQRILEMYGRTDRAGDDARNLALSRRRLQAVQAHLLDQGVPPETALSKKNCKALGEAFWAANIPGSPAVADGTRSPQGRTIIIFSWPSLQAYKDGTTSKHKDLLEFGRSFPEEV